MAYFRISELPPGVVPLPQTALFETSLIDATTVSGYDSHRVTTQDLFTDITLHGTNNTAPTPPPGSNTGQIATTSFVTLAVDTAVNNIVNEVLDGYLPLTGGTLSGDLYAPAVHVTQEYWLRDRTGTEQWAIYTEAGALRFWQTSDRLTLTAGGYLTAKDFRSDLNVYVPNGHIVVGSGNYMDLYDNGNSHIESNTSLWLNSNGAPVVTNGHVTVNNWLDIVNNLGRGLGLNDTYSGVHFGIAPSNGYLNFGTIYSSGDIATRAIAIDTAGNCYNASGSWVQFSARSTKLQESIAPYTTGLAAVTSLNPVTFQYTQAVSFGADSPTHIGLLADEVEPIMPEIVGDATVAVDGVPTPVGTILPGALVYALINAVKEVAQRLEAVEAALAPIKHV